MTSPHLSIPADIKLNPGQPNPAAEDTEEIVTAELTFTDPPLHYLSSTLKAMQELETVATLRRLAADLRLTYEQDAANEAQIRALKERIEREEALAVVDLYNNEDPEFVKKLKNEQQRSAKEKEVKILRTAHLTDQLQSLLAIADAHNSQKRYLELCIDIERDVFRLAGEVVRYTLNLASLAEGEVR
jgi:hypothetical protein